MRNLTADYERIEAIKKAYQEAESQEAKETARADMQAINDEINAERKEYGRILRFYQDSKEKENERLDISDNIWDREVEGLIETMRDADIKEFTYSSTWTSAVETAWLFLQSGCSLKGMVEVNGNREWMSEKATFEKKHAYLFTID